MTSKPILRLPDLNRTFVLKTDASGLGLGCALLQADPNDKDKLFPIAYASRKLTCTELNYSVSEAECLCVVWAVEKFHVYLYGRQFILHTDHQPLVSLSSAKMLNRRLMRYSLTLSQYSFKTVYTKGSDHHMPDFLSRHCVTETGKNDLPHDISGE